MLYAKEGRLNKVGEHGLDGLEGALAPALVHADGLAYDVDAAAPL